MIASAARIGRVEAIRVTRNPALWLSMTPALLWALLVDTPIDEHFLLTGYGLVFAWFAAMAVTAVAARRISAPDAGQTLDTLPGGPDVRTLGLGFGSIAAGACGLVVTIVVLIIRSPASVLGSAENTIPRDLPILRPTVAQLVQGPLVLVVFATLGLLIGRWVPGWLLVPALLVPIAVQFLWFGVWNSEGTPWYVWLLPMATGWVAGEWVGECDTNDATICDLQLSGFDRTTPWWHAAYLVALAVLFVSVAVALHGRREARWWVLGSAAAVLALGAVQVVTFERWAP